MNSWGAGPEEVLFEFCVAVMGCACPRAFVSDGGGGRRDGHQRHEGPAAARQPTTTRSLPRMTN
jgi:hypothetical protein